MFPFSEVLLYFVSPGAQAQGMGGLTWSLLLMPVYAVALAGVLGMFVRRSWEDIFPPVVAGLSATWLLALLTEPGIFPLALLLNWRVGLSVLNGFDVVLLGLCGVGLAMAFAFKIYDRDLARLTLACVLGYVGAAGWWSWQARNFGLHYAELQQIAEPVVRVMPQALSPLNWRIVVAERNGKLHDTMVTLGRGSTRERDTNDDPYRPRDSAVWKIYRRFGGLDVPDETQRQVRLAWYAWQNTPFAWLGRYAVFDRMYAPQEVGVNMTCVGFRDFRAEGKSDVADGTYVVCPSGSHARVFQPSGPMDKKGNWPGMRELIAYESARS
jgi:inner membrane protein